MAHSGLMSSPLLGCSWSSQSWELKILITDSSARRSQQIVTTRLGLLGQSHLTPLFDPTHHRLSDDSSALQGSKTYGCRSDDTTKKYFIDLRPRVPWCHVHLWTLCQTWCLLCTNHVQNRRPTAEHPSDSDPLNRSPVLVTHRWKFSLNFQYTTLQYLFLN